ncbi:MAG: M4 family metallopeptidase, partial [Bacteroidota bacterium]
NDPIIKHWQAAATGELGQAQVRTRYSGVQTIQTTKLDVLNEPNPLFDVTGGLPALSDSRSRPVNTPYLLTGGADAWVLIDQTREAVGSDLNRVETYDVNGLGGAPLSVPIYGQARSFTDPDNVWDNMLGAASAEHVRGIQSRTNPAERQYDDDIAWDAHWGAGVVHDYWMDRHSRESYDGEGAPIRSYVHIGNAFDNAFWNGSVMSYGDGQTFKSLTSLDVCGHEVGHAVCSSTSDLVYARQSGGMNEGFSDIWAATTEYYQIEKTPSLAYDPITNPAGYRPFGIGEQIDPTGDNATTDRSVGALRWMDAPKTEGDPDTFGGERWTETENCEPTLANDQCGVHSNSGVLNKWFYLMTVGSGANPNSPDSQYAGTNANVDDSVNDNGDTYSVNGLGFKIAEQIAFGAEVLLTPNGTFAECRLASVVIARNMSNQIITTENGTFNFTGGICGNIEEDVVNAWFGVGVGDVFDCSGLDALQAGFLGVDKAVVESATADECDAVSIIQVEYFLNSEAAIAQTITVDAASTAIEGKDFIIDQKVFTNTTGGYVAQSFDIKIINDALVEEPETIVLKFAANSSSDFDTRTITINDDDVIPTIGIGTATLLDEKFENGLPDGWSTDNKVIDGPQRWYVGIVAPSSTQPANATGMAYVGQAQGSDTYQGTQGNNDIYLVSKQIDGRGFENITVQFDWGAGGERDAGINAEPFDYGEFTYSFDGIEFISTSEIFAGDGSVSPLTPVQGTYNELLSFLDGKQFFLGWRWFNDPLVGDGPSFSVDNVLVTGVPAQIESELGHGKIARVDAGTEVFFLSNEDGGVIASINNAASDLGCV